MTTYRLTEHFQGGPTTRNIDWLCELQPEPVIEMNFFDAVNWGNWVSGAPIKSGDQVYLMSARTATEIGPFRAIVGSGFEWMQPVAIGVVAIPWHWGRKAINQDTNTRTYSEGASANDLCIDALDANTKMPESKACLVRISRIDHV
jgi:formate dehydrogenase major subunit